MHRIDTANARPDANGTGKAGYHLNNDLVGVDPTNLDPAALNAIQEEICKVIESTGTALVKGNNSQLWVAINWAITQQIALGTASIAINAIYPVGITVEFAVNVDPNLLWAGTTWVRFAQGKTTVGYQNGDPDFGTIGQTGGKKGHKMTLNNMIEHSHKRNQDNVSENAHTGIGGGAAGDWSGANGYIHNYTDTGATGQADPDAIPTLPPYVVTAKWLRTA